MHISVVLLLSYRMPLFTSKILLSKYCKKNPKNNVQNIPTLNFIATVLIYEYLTKYGFRVSHGISKF